MVNIERLTPDGWKTCTKIDNIHAALMEAKELCTKNASTYRLIRSDELICIIRDSGIIWINAKADVTEPETSDKAFELNQTVSISPKNEKI